MKNKRIYIWRDGKLFCAKDGTTIEGLKGIGYFDRHPGAIVCKPAPTMQTLNKWSYDGIAKALDGCKVEPDGTCQHGLPSWLLALGYI